MFCLTPETGDPKTVATDRGKSNGLAVSGDEQTLFIADSALGHDPGGPRHISAFDLKHPTIH